MASTVVIKKCTCTKTQAATYQDEKYGTQNRVCNTGEKKTAKCTVCGKEHKLD